MCLNLCLWLRATGKITKIILGRIVVGTHETRSYLPCDLGVYDMLPTSAFNRSMNGQVEPSNCLAYLIVKP